MGKMGVKRKTVTKNTRKKSDVAIIAAICDLAHRAGFEVRVVKKDKTAPRSIKKKIVSEEVLKQHWRRDFARLQAVLAKLGYAIEEGGYTPLHGNYVVVHQGKIVAAGPDYKVVVADGEQVTGLSEDQLLIVPICVRDQDAQERWQRTLMRMGMA